MLTTNCNLVNQGVFKYKFFNYNLQKKLDYSNEWSIKEEEVVFIGN